MSGSNRTLQLGLLGRDIQHSLSPHLQHLNAECLGISVQYHLFDLKCHEAEQLLVRHRNSESDQYGSTHPDLNDLDGLNITTPYKELAFRMADKLSGEAQALKAVNTLTLRDGVISAHNTDPEGVIALLKGLNLADLCHRVILIGTGGASRAAAFALAQSYDCREFVWISRDRERALKCMEWCRERWPSIRCCWLSALENHQTRHSSLNSTHLGEVIKEGIGLMISGAPPLTEAQWYSLEKLLRPHLGERFGFASEGYIIDLNYGEERLRAVKEFAQSIGVYCSGGLRMLVGQGVASFNWWTGSTLNECAQWSTFKKTLG